MQGTRQRQKGNAMKGAGTKGLGKSGEPQGRTPGRTTRFGDAKDSAGHAGQDEHKVIRLSMGVDRVDEEDSHCRSGSSSSSRSGPQPESDED